MNGPSASDLTLRWHDRRHSWRHKSEGGFDRARYEVADASERDARAFVAAHHYAVTSPPSRLRYGLYERGQLLGAVLLSIPAQDAVLTNVFPDLAPRAESLELGRLVLLDAVPANAESWFLARVWELAVREGVRGVVSFSDPVPRIAAGGRVVMPGHVGIAYQASNAAYLGRGTPRTLLVLPDWTVLNERSLQKLRAGERSSGSAERQLVAAGARPREAGESTGAWIRDALGQARLWRVRHPGCHRYAFALGDRKARRSVVVALPRGSYPKHPDLEAA